MVRLKGAGQNGGNGGKTVMTAEEIKKFNACLPPSQGAK
jgi:hypothetical protein